MIITFEVGKTIVIRGTKEVYYLPIEKVYHQWNGKSTNGKAELSNNFLSKEAMKNSTAEMECTVGIDTFSADELQNDVTEN
jgi:hypothetical protein